jgi:hypothetical protein
LIYVVKEKERKRFMVYYIIKCVIPGSGSEGKGSKTGEEGEPESGCVTELI